LRVLGEEEVMKRSIQKGWICYRGGL